MKETIKHKKLKIILFLIPAAIGIFFVFYVNFIEHGRIMLWPCPLYEAFSAACPGCGATRCVTEIMRLNFLSAFKYNSVIFVLFFFIAAVYFYAIYTLIRHSRWIKLNNKVIFAILGVMVLYTVLRNLPFFPFKLKDMSAMPFVR